MTDKQRTQYNIRYTLDEWLCQRCKKPARMQAHRIANTKVNRKVYGSKIIDDNKNLVSVCCLECNDSYNIGNNPEKCKKLVKLIETRRYMKTNEIEEYLNE
jgi:hypothetical protein